MIAVIIPTLNEASHIKALVEQLLQHAPDTLLEILVADGGSTDGTRDIVSDIALKESRVRLILNPQRIQAAGFNLAADAANPAASILIRIDAHAGYPQNVVGNLAKVLDDMDADSVVVRLHTRGTGCFQKAVAAVSNSILGTGAAAHRVGGTSRWIDHGHHAAFRRSSFSAVGGYDENFVANEDAELDVRLRRAGGKIWFAADIEVDYYPRHTPGHLARQYLRYGMGRAKNVRKNGERLKLRQLAPPLLLILMIASLGTAPFLAWTLVVPASYLALSLVSAAVLAIRRRDACILGAALALPVMHMSWGAGFLLANIRTRQLPSTSSALRVPPILRR